MTKNVIFSLKHENIDLAKPNVKETIREGNYKVPRLSTDIINNRWRAYQKNTETMLDLDPNISKFIKAALEAIVKSDVIMDQRDVYYSIRGVHGDWKLAGHPLDTIEAYDTFVGTVMEKIQLVTGYTMQSLGVRAGPRGYIIGDDETYFEVPVGRKTQQVRIAMPVGAPLKFDLVDEGVTIQTRSQKVIHYEKAAGMDSLLVSDIPKMIEAIFMTSQGYNTETATKMHRVLEDNGKPLYVLGDADPHGLSIQLMYGRASKSNAYMPDCFYPTNATILGLYPRVAYDLGLPPEKINAEHAKILDNLEKLINETHPEMLPDLEIFREQKYKWEWQALKGKDDYAPAIYMIEALRACGDKIKYVPEADVTKNAIINTIKTEREGMVEREINRLTNELLEPTKEKIKEQLREQFADQIQEFEENSEAEIERLMEMDGDDFREAVKKKLVDRPAQYWGDAARKVVNDMTNECTFDLIATVDAEVIVNDPTWIIKSEIKDPEVPEKPLTIDDITNSVESRVTGKKVLIQTIRTALEKVKGIPSQVW